MDFLFEASSATEFFFKMNRISMENFIAFGIELGVEIETIPFSSLFF